MIHYTNKPGYNGIKATPAWTFRAGLPPGPHGPGAYFTTLQPHARHLASRLMIPHTKVEYMFAFEGTEGLQPIRGGRGAYIFYSPDDYAVAAARQRFSGLSSDAQGQEG